MGNSLKPGVRVWISGENGTFMGEGRAELLQLIHETGSINEASKKMNMSYKKALKLIDTMHSQVKYKLLESETGGKGGGGTRLTDKGKEALDFYTRLKENCESFLEREFKKDYNGTES